MLNRCIAAIVFCFPLFLTNEICAQNVPEEKIRTFREQEQLDSLAIYSEHALENIFEKESLADTLGLRYINYLLYCQKHEEALKYLLLLSESSNLTGKNRALLYSNLGELFLDVRAYGLCAEHYKKALEALGEQKHHNTFYWLGSIGSSYLNLEQYDSAIVYFKKQFQYSDGYGFHERALALNNIGFSYSKTGNLKEATSYYQKALDVMEQNSLSNYDSLLIATLFDNLGKARLLSSDTSGAIEYFKMNKEKMSAAIKDQNELFILYHPYLSILIEQKNPDALELILDLKKLNQLNLFNQYKLLNMEIAFLLNFQKPVSKELYFRLSEVQDSIMQLLEVNERKGYSITSNYMLQHAELKGKLFKSQLQEERLKEQQWKRFVMLGLIIGTLLIILLILYFRYKRKKDSYEKIILEEKKINLENSLKLKQQDITNYAINLNLKQEQREELITELEKIKALGDKEIKDSLQGLIRQWKSKVSSKKSIELFNKNVDEINTEFYKKLQQHLPNITEQEKEICALIRLGLNNKEIANVRDISPNSAKVAKYRLKKKFGLKESENFTSFLQDL